MFSNWKPIGRPYNTLEEAKKWVDEQCYGIPDKYTETIEWSGAEQETR